MVIMKFYYLNHQFGIFRDVVNWSRFEFENDIFAKLLNMYILKLFVFISVYKNYY